jgi:hypothetical protein
MKTKEDSFESGVGFCIKQSVIESGLLAFGFLVLLAVLGSKQVMADTNAKIKKPAYVPKEAYDACKDKAEGAEVLVKIRRGMMAKDIIAVCWQFEDEKQLMAIPAHMLDGGKSSSAAVVEVPTQK